MLRCSNVCARSTFATGLSGNGSSRINHRLAGGFLANRIPLTSPAWRTVTGSATKKYTQGGSRRKVSRHTQDGSRIKASRKENPEYESIRKALYAARNPSISSSGREKEANKEIDEDADGEEHDGGDLALGPSGAKSKSARSTVSRKAISLELEWVQDRIALTKRVTQLLIKNDIAKATELVRAAQTNGIDCTVAWNTLFEYELKKNEPVAAFKLYNEMKKHGRKPNAQTYTIMLRGLARCTPRESFKIARAVYEGLRSPKSDMKPSIIHINAMLGVCSRHHQKDYLWEVAGTLPESGYGAPDARTFTIMVNALYNISRKRMETLDTRRQADGVAEQKAALASQGKQIWADIVHRSKRGDFIIDQSLTSAMGRLLLFCGRTRDCLDIFALLHQTMALPFLGDIETQREAHQVAAKASVPVEETHEENASENLQTDSGSANDIDATSTLSAGRDPPTEDEEFKDLFTPFEKPEIPTPNRQKNRKYEKPEVPITTPGNDELSLLISACRSIPNGLLNGKAYWSALTEKTAGRNRVRPDGPAFHEYLRLLRATRSSSEILRLIKEEMIPRSKKDTSIVQPKTFMLALSSASRDRNNVHVLDTANELLNLLYTETRTPDPRIIDKYLALLRYCLKDDIIHSAMPILTRWSKDIKSPTDVFKKRLTDAITALRPHLQRTISMLAYNTPYGRPRGAKEAPSPAATIEAACKSIALGSYTDARHDESFDMSLAILQQTSQLYDQLLNRRRGDLVTAEERTVLQGENQGLKKMLAQTTRVFEKGRERELDA
ncbi:hypothetical protein FQN50_009648 [Emmonsiellopsis sp. PD_5]|nr:hypothetical protein FQN50_009648 [Emmonsiellopsis sp. PD_5]